jgi:hypothetical protein
LSCPGKLGFSVGKSVQKRRLVTGDCFAGTEFDFARHFEHCTTAEHRTAGKPIFRCVNGKKTTLENNTICDVISGMNLP